MSVEEALIRGDERDLWQVWDAFNQRRMWRQVVEAGGEEGNQERVRVAEAQLAELPMVTALDGLRASGRLVELLTSRRWYVMQQAKEDGASWEQIGEALGMSRQSAWEWYRRKIADREHHVGDLHDAVRARAALAEEVFLT